MTQLAMKKMHARNQANRFDTVQLMKLLCQREISSLTEQSRVADPMA